MPLNIIDLLKKKSSQLKIFIVQFWKPNSSCLPCPNHKFIAQWLLELFLWPTSFCLHTMAIFRSHYSKHTTHYALYIATHRFALLCPPHPAKCRPNRSEDICLMFIFAQYPKESNRKLTTAT